MINITNDNGMMRTAHVTGNNFKTLSRIALEIATLRKTNGKIV